MSERVRGKAPKAVRTSDVARPRTLLLSALGAAAGISVALVAQGEPITTARPIARPHAKIACATCHGEATSVPAPATACKTCHGASHGSTRAAHQKLIAKGEMSCPTCHHQHTGAQGVTFDDDKAIRWGAGAAVDVPLKNATIAKGTTVPLIGIVVCTQCHDATRASDPISACIGPKPKGGVEQCFDEHTRVREALPPGPVCAKQHGADRFIAWDAAREIAATTPWVSAGKSEQTPWAPAGGALAGALVLGSLSTALEQRRRQAVTPAKAIAPAAVKKLPVINPSTCLGCYACVDACPFDVLAIEKYVAVVARPEECCGVILCEQVCPNGSLRVVDGEPIQDRPATDDDLESRDVPGLYIAGDLTGLPLIKNAINQGVRAVDRIAATLPRRRSGTDIVVIGAGPAGLSAALRAKEKGLACVVIEQATVAASIKSFPRDKIVHDPPLDLPIEGELWLEQATKEDLLAQWTRIVRTRALDVREGQRVVDIAREAERFVVTTDQGKKFQAARVILAIGRRGTPRELDAEIGRGAESKISYALADARSFEGKRIVVVGLGDSAMEAAIALARQPGTTVTMTYRGKTFARGKAKNIRQLEALVAEKKVKLLFETQPVSVTTSSVIVEGTGPHKGRRTIAADAVIVLIGGMPSWDLLVKAGIKRPG